MSRTKVLLITNMISPYRTPIFNYLHNQSDLEFRVIVLSEKEENREWQIEKDQIKFDYQILPGLHKIIWGKKKEIAIHLNWGLWRILRRYEPDVVITSGYDAPSYWEAFLYCKIQSKHFILWNETTLLSTEKTQGLVGSMKRTIIKEADGYISFGSKAAEYLEYFGAPKERIHFGLNTVDMEWYRMEWYTVHEVVSFEAERSKYPPVMLLYVGQLIERKNAKRLLEALAKLQDRDIGIFIVGSGPKEVELKEFCLRYGLQNVYFKGFVQQSDLSRYYAMADILVLPSVKEVWGLVVNEALATGLYILCSNSAGAADDLIMEGWNGKLFDPYDVERLAKLIRETKEQIKEIRARRDAISEHGCQKFSIERLAMAFISAIRAAKE